MTPAGHYFYQNTLKWLADIEDIKQETLALSQTTSHILRLGYPYSYQGEELTKTLLRMNQNYPEVTFIITSGNHEILYNDLVEGKLDLVINDQCRAFAKSYENCVLGKLPLYLEIAEQDPLG